jgi:two-component system NtrC family sensor kinase
MTAPHGFRLPDDPQHRDRLAEIGQLAGGLVHELKNPLGAIRLNVDMLLEQCRHGSPDPAKLERRLQRIAAGASHLDQIINAYLGYARPGRPDRSRVDVNGLLTDLLREQDAVLRQAEVTASFLPTPELFAVPADINQLRSVFLNIILNACDALRQRPADRRLVIATRNRHARIRVVIANNGPPLNEYAAAHLFEPFFSEKTDGTGLGLAIVRQLVALHHGKVTVSSDPQQGVSFTVELPTNMGPARPSAELPMPSTPAAVHPD